MELKKAVICGGTRIPFVKSFTSYLDDSNQDLMTFVLKALVKRFHLEGKMVGDVALGAIMKHSRDWNLARESVLGSGLHPHTPAFDLQRACGTSLEAVNLLALKIKFGQIETGIAAGTDTNSDAPISYRPRLAKAIIKLSQARTMMDRLKALQGIGLNDIKPNVPAVVEPRTKLSMGQHTEKMAQEWKIPRKDQDELSLASHMNGIKAYERGFMDDLVVEYRGLKRDPFLRKDTSLEKLGKLKPAFDFTGAGTLTAGNSSPLSDGAAAVLLASEEAAKKNGWPVLAYVRDAEAAAVDFVEDGEGLLMAPTYAVARLLKRNNLKLQDFDFYEIHEAFAAQVLCTLRAWESDEYCRKRLKLEGALGSIDRAKMNVVGSSVALGHPFAATGARIAATLAKLLHEKGSGRGLISVCTAGGMGVAMILEK